MPQRERVIPLLIHGDAAFAGQGMVAETLNFSQLDGLHAPAARMHVVINNQIGFTTDPRRSALDARTAPTSRRWFRRPIFHVNGDDPGGLRPRGAAGLRFPPAVPARRGDRHVLLPPARPQRGRRSQLHAAADVPARSRSTRRCATLYAERLMREGVVTAEEVADCAGSAEASGSTRSTTQTQKSARSSTSCRS